MTFPPRNTARVTVSQKGWRMVLSWFISQGKQRFRSATLISPMPLMSFSVFSILRGRKTASFEWPLYQLCWNWNSGERQWSSKCKADKTQKLYLFCSRSVLAGSERPSPGGRGSETLLELCLHLQTQCFNSDLCLFQKPVYLTKLMASLTLALCTLCWHFSLLLFLIL